MATDQIRKTLGKATDTVSGVADTATKPSGELGDAVRKLAGAATSRASTALANKIMSTSGRLQDYASGGGDGGGLLEAVTGGKPSIKRQAMMGAVKGGMSGLMDKVKDALTGGGGKGGKIKVTNIVEQIDVGAPIDLVYDQWTRFTDFPHFMKKVENVEQVSDEKLEWKAQVFWSHRTWEATILEQVPNERIVWRSKGAKGHVDGAVTFHELTPDLTRVVVVLEYHPQGLFERTGNIWRAQGRRARLELKHFQRYVMTEAVLHPDDIQGWHGEIHDGQVQDTEEEEPDTGEEEPESEEDERGRDEDEAGDEESEDEEPEEAGEDEEQPERRPRVRAAAGRGRGSRR
ncbi:SRPBCC family protein [Amycolatopsis viridis]|uniref:Membrane protein n=1 Tax=Amycolatopsis viridis TaxID=185678 RepID=A0ABX0SZ47_9PSEU|nr:SRPBCC family protein [Amycolatopsis viridis]NIH80585.1 putative membrane protein [Amycolatopsis viridis]